MKIKTISHKFKMGYTKTSDYPDSLPLTLHPPSPTQISINKE